MIGHEETYLLFTHSRNDGDHNRFLTLFHVFESYLDLLANIVLGELDIIFGVAAVQKIEETVVDINLKCRSQNHEGYLVDAIKCSIVHGDLRVGTHCDGRGGRPCYEWKD